MLTSYFTSHFWVLLIQEAEPEVEYVEGYEMEEEEEEEDMEDFALGVNGSTHSDDGKKKLLTILACIC
jgi:hypothetical protein